MSRRGHQHRWVLEWRRQSAASLSSSDRRDRPIISAAGCAHEKVAPHRGAIRSSPAVVGDMRALWQRWKEWLRDVREGLHERSAVARYQLKVLTVLMD